MGKAKATGNASTDDGAVALAADTLETPKECYVIHPISSEHPIVWVQNI